MTTQNVYDDPDFFAAYLKLRRSVQGLAGAPEWPALSGLLPDLAGRRVLDLGCGLGWFGRWARAQGAASVLAVDVSAKMLTRARAMTGDAAIEFREMDLEHARFEAGAFDLAFSSLAFHYLADLDRLLAGIGDSLRPGGTLVFSVEHPVFTAPSRQQWITADEGRRVWPVERYAIEGPRLYDWLGAAVVKHHRTFGTWVNALLRRGFVLRHVQDWSPSTQQVSDDPALAVEIERPMFLLIRADRPDG